MSDICVEAFIIEESSGDDIIGKAIDLIKYGFQKLIELIKKLIQKIKDKIDEKKKSKAIASGQRFKDPNASISIISNLSPNVFRSPETIESFFNDVLSSVNDIDNFGAKKGANWSEELYTSGINMIVDFYKRILNTDMPVINPDDSHSNFDDDGSTPFGNKSFADTVIRIDSSKIGNSAEFVKNSVSKRMYSDMNARDGENITTVAVSEVSKYAGYNFFMAEDPWKIINSFSSIASLLTKCCQSIDAIRAAYKNFKGGRSVAYDWYMKAYILYIQKPVDRITGIFIRYIYSVNDYILRFI